jgi:hypothetical protein
MLCGFVYWELGYTKYSTSIDPDSSGRLTYPKCKYHWIRWEALCKPKSLVGLGIVDTKLMNICLMAKWIWKVYAGEQGLWADIL